MVEDGDTVEFRREPTSRNPRAKNVVKKESWWSKKKITAILLSIATASLVVYCLVHPEFVLVTYVELLMKQTVLIAGYSIPLLYILIGVGAFIVGLLKSEFVRGLVAGAVGVIILGLFVYGGAVSLGIVPANQTLLSSSGHMPPNYYEHAEEYVKKNYGLVPNQNIDDLETFLLSLEPFPSYDMDKFSCTESTARLEWLLEGAGFDAKVANDIELSEIDAPTIGGHTWVIVELQNGDLVAIEATFFTQSNYNPPGIIMKPNGAYKKYSWKYKMFQEWKEKYPPSQYAYDPNMTLSEWESKYLTELDLGPFSTPSQYGYYHPAETYKAPAETMKGSAVIPKSQWDWWNVFPYSQTSPFSKWD